MFCLLPLYTGCAGRSMPFVSGLTCNSSTAKGAGQVACTVTISSSAHGGGQGVNLVSSNSAVVVPASIMVPGQATTASFNATVTPVSAALPVTVTASSGGYSRSFLLTLASAVPTLSVSQASIDFGDVPENQPATQTLTLTASGDLPVTITGATPTGVGFSVSGTTFPVALNPGQTLSLGVSFAPTTVGPVEGNLLIVSNSSTGNDTVVGLTGTGVAAIMVSVAPLTAQIMTGGSEQFSATLTNTTNTAVVWSVSGTGCSGATCGTISPTGLYSAPAAVPNPSTVIVTATSEADPTSYSTAVVTLVPRTGNTYYLSPSGDDTNDGLTTSTPWASPKHNLNCGDVIIAAPSSAYQYWNFNFGNWGTVNCSAGNSVAWLQCATFDGCKITSGGGITVDQSFWGVQGWEVTSTLAYAGCFSAAANTTTPVEIHHIIFANDIANGCQSGGFTSYNNWTNLAASVDYITVVGNIAYNATQGSTNCYSGISIYEPIQSDSAAGTHIFVAGNFSYGNVQPSTCANYPAPGADGIIFDTFDGDQANLPSPYAAQAAAENNMLLGNNGRGVEVQNNIAGSAHAPIYVQNNTAWGNGAVSDTSASICGELVINAAFDTSMTTNLAMTTAATGCGSNTLNGIQAYNSDGTDVVDDNFVYSASGNNFYSWGTGAGGTGSLNFGAANVTGQDPKFANPGVPSAPSCSTASNVADCMAGVVANFQPGNTAAAGFGYQPASGAGTDDPLFPKWLCNVNLPAGLVTMSCQ